MTFTEIRDSRDRSELQEHLFSLRRHSIQGLWPDPPMQGVGEIPMLLHIRDETGATMVEYSFMLAFVFIAAMLAVQAFGGSVLSLFQTAVDVVP